MQNSKQVYEIDGRDFGTLEEFYDAISESLIPGAAWGRNLDAFNDILRGGFGTPDEGFILRWKNARLSRDRLGYQETIRWLEFSLTHAHPMNRNLRQKEIQLAHNGLGPTLFDKLVEIINIHCAGGEEAKDGVELILD